MPSIKTIKAQLARRGIDHSHCVEKDELLALLEGEAAPPPYKAASKCPFSSAQGYTTRQGREDWLLEREGTAGHHAAGVTESLKADMDPKQPLYYWQIHSILGPERIEAFVRNFYTRIFEDREAGSISHAFDRIGPLSHHVATQSAFWVDSFGGGRVYHGGDYRLNFHHENNAAEVMTAEGAKRWMLHMGRALCAEDFSAVDARIKPVVVDFLRTKVRKYARAERASQYDAWRFDERDFAFVAKDPEMVRLHRKGNYTSMAPEDEARLRNDLADASAVEGMSTGRLKALLESRGVSHAHCVEKGELRALALESLDVPLPSAAEAKDDDPGPQSLEDIDRMSLKEVKAWLTRRKVSLAACVETSDVRDLARLVWDPTGGVYDSDSDSDRR